MSRFLDIQLDLATVNRAAAEDVFQDSMLAVLKHLPGYRGDAPLGAWVRQVTLNHCLAHLRSPWQKARRTLREWVGVDGEDDSDLALQVVQPVSPEAVDLARALDELAATQRTVVWLHDVEGLTHEEIAAAFGRSVSFSKSQLARAHALLRARLVDPARQQPLLRAEVAAQGQVS